MHLQEQDMEQYWHWMCSIPGLYRSQMEVLLRCFETPEGIWHASGKELDYLEQKGCRWIGAVREFRTSVSPELVLNRDWEAGIQFISRQHEAYPQRLAALEDAPYGLFWKGRLPVQEKKSVAVVGSRLCTRPGREWAERLAAAVARAGGNLISGAAYGIDGAAQWSALKQGGDSFAVTGCGLDCWYPTAHTALYEQLCRKGGVISEYPVKTQPLPRHFPQRNRIISGLADVVVIVEARKKSGSLITAGFALEQGRRVMALPGRPEDELSQGCNELINQGAELILSEEEFIQSVFPEYNKKNKKLSDSPALAPAEKLVYSSLNLQSSGLWELLETTSLSLAELSSSLLSLEQKGLIKEGSCGRYRRTQ